MASPEGGGDTRDAQRIPDEYRIPMPGAGAPEEPVTTLLTKINDEYYNMEHGRRGICVIINQEVFDEVLDLDVRYGTDLDAERLKLTFERLSFIVHTSKNVCKENIRTQLEFWANFDHKDCDAFVLCMFSHGARDFIYATDGLMSIDEIISPFAGDKCRSLLGKPKLFFFQACQGKNFDKGGLVYNQMDRVNREVYRLPARADILIAHSTVPGFVAWKDDEGSWFIQSLCDVLGDRELVLKEDILRLLRRVNKLVAIKFESWTEYFEECYCKQVPWISFSLTRLLSLAPPQGSETTATAKVEGFGQPAAGPRLNADADKDKIQPRLEVAPVPALADAGDGPETMEAPPAPVKRVRGSMKRVRSWFSKSKRQDDTHEFDKFCESLAIQLKKMPYEQALQCEVQLLNVVNAKRSANRQR